MTEFLAEVDRKVAGGMTGFVEHELGFSREDVLQIRCNLRSKKDSQVLSSASL